MSEQISALMDGEIAVEDAGHLMSSLQSSRQSAEAWSQYHLIGDAMRGSRVLSKDFKQNLMHKIDMEPTVLAPKSLQVTAERTAEIKDRLPAKWAIAASFAAVMAVGWVAVQQVQPGNAVPAFEMARADVVEQAIPNEYMAAHQSSAPSASSYYIQSVSYSE